MESLAEQWFASAVSGGWDLWLLGVWSFLAATIVPLSSEVALLAVLWLGSAVGPALAVASVGNALGALTSYALGRWLVRHFRDGPRRTWMPRVDASAEARIRKWGWVGLLGSWLPIVGDPLLVAAGWAALPVWQVVAVAVPCRVARYVVLVWPWW